MGEKSNDLQVLTSQKTENRRMRTRPFIHFVSAFVPRTCWTICWLPMCIGHRFSDCFQLKITASDLNSIVYAFMKEVKDLTVRADCRWSIAFSLMKCCLCWVQSWRVPIMLPNIAVLDMTNITTSWNRLLFFFFFLLFKFCCFTENLSVYPRVCMLK